MIPMTYEDFLSEVKKYLNNSQVAFSKTGPNDFNSDFSATDIEFGKIYMVWKVWSKSIIWFLTPYKKGVGDKLKLYWCSVYSNSIPNELDKGIRLMQKHHRDMWWDERKWGDFTWAGDDWVEISSIKNNFINWNELPWGGK
jgi:hypothetical protein